MEPRVKTPVKTPARIGPAAGYTMRTPVPLRTEADLHTTRVGIPQDASIAVAGPVDHDSLAKAIRRSVGHEGMRAEDARTIAAHVLNFFGFNERIIDNVLEPDDRDTFYMLEDTGILETERDETTLYDGREWRIHYWMFRKDRIFELAQQESRAMAEAGEVEVVYSSNASRSGAFHLPTGPTGPAADSPSFYHDLGDEIWLERKRPAAPATPGLAPRAGTPGKPARPKGRAPP
jgi:hypothetical protein